MMTTEDSHIQGQTESPPANWLPHEWGENHGAAAFFSNKADYQNLFQTFPLKLGELYCELGSGEGLGLLTLAEEYSSLVGGIGLEGDSRRVNISKENIRGIKNLDVIHADFREDFSLPRANLFYLYLGAGPALHRLLIKLEELAKTHQFHLAVVEAEGETLPKIRHEFPFLQKVGEWELESQRHDEKGIVFQSQTKIPEQTEIRRWQDQFMLASKDEYIQVEITHMNESFYVDAYGSEIHYYHGRPYFESKYPRRLFDLSQISFCFPQQAVESRFLKDRRQGTFFKKNQQELGWVQKIYPDGVEFSCVGKITDLSGIEPC